MLMSSVKKSLKVLANCCQLIWVTLLWCSVGHFLSKMKIGFSGKEVRLSSRNRNAKRQQLERLEELWKLWTVQDEQTEVKREWTDGRSLDGERTRCFTLPQHWDQGCRVKFGFLRLFVSVALDSRQPASCSHVANAAFVTVTSGEWRGKIPGGMESWKKLRISVIKYSVS